MIIGTIELKKEFVNQKDKCSGCGKESNHNEHDKVSLTEGDYYFCDLCSAKSSTIDEFEKEINEPHDWGTNYIEYCFAFRCLKCGHAWPPNVNIYSATAQNLETAKSAIEKAKPKTCSKCRSPYWDRPRKNKK